MRQLLRITATFALASVFTAGMAFAQETTDITQVGDDNVHNADFQTANDFWEVTVEQRGDDNFAQNTQVSSFKAGNKSDIFQQQLGNKNIATSEHAGNSDIDQIQDGNRNKLRLRDWSSKNQATQIQRGNDNGAKALSEGPNPVNGFSNNVDRLFQRQLGNRNVLYFQASQMRPDGITIDMRQDGNDNVGRLENMNAVNNAPSPSTYDTDQEGNGNYFRIDGNSADWQTVDILQDGNQNEIRGDLQAAGFDVDATQIGNGNCSALGSAMCP